MTQRATISHWREQIRQMQPRPDVGTPGRWLGTLHGHELRFDVDASLAVTVTIPIAPEFQALVVLSPGEALSVAGVFTTGDSDFDEAVVVFAPEALAWRFDAPTRRELSALVAAGGRIQGGVVCLSAHARVAASAIAATLERLASMATRLGPTAHAHRIDALLRIARSDPEARVRERFGGFANSPDYVVTAARQAILAASGDEALPILRDHLSDASLPASARALAVSRMIVLAPVKELLALPVDVWADTQIDVVGEALLQRAASLQKGDRHTCTLLARAILLRAQGPLHKGLAGLAFEQVIAPLTTDDVSTLDRLIEDRQTQRLAARAMVTHATVATLLAHASDSRWVEVWAKRELTPFLQRALAIIRDAGADPRALGRGVAFLMAVVHPIDLAATWALDLVAALAEATALDANHEVFDILVELIEHADATVRHRALGALMRQLDSIAPDVASAVIAVKLALSTEWLRRHAPICASEHDAGAVLLAELVGDLDDADTDLRQSYLETMVALALRHASDRPRVVVVLVDELSNTLDEHVLSAIDGLAQLGGHDVIVALEPLTRGLFRSLVMKTRAREAIDAISQRAGDPRGALTVAPDSDGALSLPDED